MNGPQHLPTHPCRIYIGYCLCPWTSLYIYLFFIHFSYSDIWADIYETEFQLYSSLFVASLQETYYISPFIASFSILRVALLNGQNPEGFSSVFPICFMYEIIFATLNVYFQSFKYVNKRTLYMLKGKILNKLSTIFFKWLCYTGCQNIISSYDVFMKAPDSHI